MQPELVANQLTLELKSVGTTEKAQAVARFFPEPINSVGALANDITQVAKSFHHNYSELEADDVLAISEYLLANGEYHEDVLLAFLILDKYVGKAFDDALLDRFEYWLEHYVSN